jgi:hypothetical protein
MRPPPPSVSASLGVASAPQATATAAAPPRIALDWRATGSAGPQLFSISGRAWRLDLVCSGVPSDRASGTALLLSTKLPNASTMIDHLTYVCPAGDSGGQATARFRTSGDFTLNVDSADAAVVWEVLVTDIP